MKLFGTAKNEDGILNIGGINVTDLADKHGTPLYIMDQELIEENMRKFKRGFTSDELECEVIYASKAFMTTAMCQLVEREGLSLDVVSGGELFTAKAAGYPMKNIYMHGNNKTVEELKMAVDYGVGHIIIDNLTELHRLERICDERGRKAKVLLRVNPGIEAHTHEYIQTSKYSSKFGESIFTDEIFDVVKKFHESTQIDLLGFHCHIGSQIFDETPFFSTIVVMFDFIKSLHERIGFDTRVLNLGGGFGIYYAKGDEPIELETFVRHMIKNLEKRKREYDIPLERVMIEPGRSIVANAGTTLYNVGGVKKTFSGKEYIFIDGGMTDNIRPALYQAEYEGTIATRMNEEKNYTATVAGKCCESGDVLIHDAKLQEAEEGDILAIASTGAYNYSMANNYNRLIKPAVVFVKNGEDKVVVKRENYEDIIRNDMLLYD